jgi:hypothetical protein
MTGPGHYRRAEELAAEAHRPLGQGDGQATAGASGPSWPRPMRGWLSVAGQGAGELEAVHLRTGPGSRGTRPGHGTRDDHLHDLP